MKKTKRRYYVLVGIFFLFTGVFFQIVPQSKADVYKIMFADKAYFYRWSKNSMYEFTPQNQENLTKWIDMITFHYYPKFRSVEKLASVANAVLTNYQNSGAVILRTNSVPRSPEKPAEHFIAAIFKQKNSIEFSEIRFLFVDGIGASMVASHKFYGKNREKEAIKWIKKHGTQIEIQLMNYNDIPSHKSLKNLLKEHL